jgi:hypothetical protein
VRYRVQVPTNGKDNEAIFDWSIDEPMRMNMSRFSSYLSIENKQMRCYDNLFKRTVKMEKGIFDNSNQ